MKKVYSYRNMKRDLKKLSFYYPELLRVFRLAKTADGNQIYGMALGNRRAKKRIVIQASMHAREWFNTELVMQMVERCCRQWKKNAFYHGVPYRRLFKNVCFFILPMVNPDGVSIHQYGISGIRHEALRAMFMDCRSKDFRGWKANARGVDLNRNFSTGFARDTKIEKGSQDYAGKRPFSERETRALVKLVFTVYPQAVINYHTTGHLIYYKEDTKLVRLLGKMTGYRLCREDDSTNGNFGDWLSEVGIDWCTVETCIGKAPSSRKQLVLEWKRNRDVLAALAKMYGEYVCHEP
ncbi:MAG: hypothetical protein HFH73_03635 [Lachnospiraceae bacterium]|nr:hypothetical protein [Lachnospiraceae bacterium]